MTLSIIKNIFYNYSAFYKKTTCSTRLLKYYQLLKIIKYFYTKKVFIINKIGNSIENRNIFSIRWGNGNIKILIWSQMHGNETTGTKSIFDILNFLYTNNCEFIKHLFNTLTIIFIPMLNPDGSEYFKRRNSIDIDLNRDAMKLQSPEIRILFSEINKNQPDFLFNLHDQRSIYNVGCKNFNPSILSFLSPSLDKSCNETNLAKIKSMGVIQEIVKLLNNLLPNIGGISRFSDKYYKNATGDFLQKKGYPCILLEAGNYPEDENKNLIRKYNFMSIILGFYCIVTKNINKNYKLYSLIEKNENILLDKIYRNINIIKNNYNFFIDIGLIKYYSYNLITKKIDTILKVVEIGDLSNKFSYENVITNKIFYKNNKRNYPKIGDYDNFRFK